jgi:hypothetical protein
MAETAAICTRCKKPFPLRFQVIKGQDCPIKQCQHCREQNKAADLKRGKRVRVNQSVAGGPKIDWDAKTASCVRCSRSFPLEFRKLKGVDVAIANCQRCRDIRKEIESKRKKDPKRLASRDVHISGEKFQEGRARFRDSDKGKECMKRGAKTRREKVRNDPGLRLVEAIRGKMIGLANGQRQKSSTVQKYTGFKTAEEMMLHFKGTFTAGMTRDNFGFGHGKWTIGHRIARAMYDFKNKEDVMRCQNPANLFAQWYTENVSMGVKLPPTDMLMALKNQWPLSWNDQLPSDRKALEKLARSGKLHC